VIGLYFYRTAGRSLDLSDASFRPDPDFEAGTERHRGRGEDSRPCGTQDGWAVAIPGQAMTALPSSDLAWLHSAGLQGQNEPVVRPLRK